MQKASLIAGLRSLPKPKNEFAIVAPDVDEDEEVYVSLCILLWVSFMERLV